MWLFSNGLVGHMTQDNEDSFKKPLAVAYFNVDYTLNPKGMHNYFKEINGLLFLHSLPSSAFD